MIPEVEKRAVAFIRSIGNRCMPCMRRSEENCRDCISRWANSILRDIDNESKPSMDYSLQARMMMIVDCLGKAGRPLLSSEIDLKQSCTKQLKRWTLVRMVKNGLICRALDPDNPNRYRYFLPKRKTT